MFSKIGVFRLELHLVGMPPSIQVQIEVKVNYKPFSIVFDILNSQCGLYTKI